MNFGSQMRFKCSLFLFRERSDSRGAGGLLHSAQGEGGHQAHQPGEVSDEHGRTAGEPPVWTSFKACSVNVEALKKKKLHE